MTRAELESLFNGFIAQWDGKPCEAEDPTNLDQCMDLAFTWVDALGIPRETIRHQFAHLIWDAPNSITYQYFDLIPNNPDDTEHPLKGDIVVLGVKTGIPVGHVCIETGKSDGYNLISFDENWDTLHYNKGVDSDTGDLIPYCRTVIHANYYDVLGWLRPKTQEPAQPTPEVVVTPTTTESTTPTVEIPVEATTTGSNPVINVAVDTTQVPEVTDSLNKAVDKAIHGNGFNLFQLILQLITYIKDKFFR